MRTRAAAAAARRVARVPHSGAALTPQMFCTFLGLRLAIPNSEFRTGGQGFHISQIWSLLYQ